MVSYGIEVFLAASLIFIILFTALKYLLWKWSRTHPNYNQALGVFIFIDLIQYLAVIYAIYISIFATSTNTYYISLNQTEVSQLSIHSAFNTLISTNQTILEATIVSNPGATLCYLQNLTAIYTPTNTTLNYSQVQAGSITNTITAYYCSYQTNHTRTLKRILGAFKSKIT